MNTQALLNIESNNAVNRKDISSQVESVVIRRVWAMPNKNTFSIKPIGKLVYKYLYGKSIDPFANASKVAEITNDMNSIYKTDYCMEADKFLEIFEKDSIDSLLFDPPYSLRQVKECYEGTGRGFFQEHSQNAIRWTKEKNIIKDIVRCGGHVISCGWNSHGIGIKRGFKIVEILLVSHGSAHNDTIVTVERKAV